MQVKAFRPLLDKYKDFDTNPGAEPLVKIEERMYEDATQYYLIRHSGEVVGAVRVQLLEDGAFRIAPIFILPEHQGHGFARVAMKLLEDMYPQARVWKLDTIAQEEPLCRLYEKAGYRPTGRYEQLQEGMTLIYYEKSQFSTENGRNQAETHTC